MNHPLRPIRSMVDTALEQLSPGFEALYSRRGRPSIAPEKLLAGAAVASTVYGTERADVDGAVGIQSSVPVVCGVEYG